MDCGAVIVTLIAASSLGPRAQAPDQTLAAQWRGKIAASQRSYVGYTQSQLFEAVKGVLSAIGPSNFVVKPDPLARDATGGATFRDCLLAAQSHDRFYTWTRNYWNVCLTTETDGRTTMQASATVQRSDGLLPQYLPPFKSDIPILPDRGLTIAEAALFFERVDLRLQDKAKAWMSCRKPIGSDHPKDVGAYICRGGVIGSVN